MLNAIVGFVLGFIASYFAQWPTPPRQLWTQLRFRRFRERRCYTLPGSKTFIVPACSGEYGSPYVSAHAIGCVNAVSGMMRQSGFADGHDFDLVFPDPTQDSIAEDIRTENLVLVCGPLRNQLLASVLRDHPELLHDVRFDAALHAFHHRERVYRAEDSRDWALVAVKRNPYNPRRRLVILFGLTSIGTKGAGFFYAKAGSIEDRKQAAEVLETSTGEIEILLAVDHTPDRKTIRRVQPVVLMRAPPGQLAGVAMAP
jgi:hypothetical protein